MRIHLLPAFADNYIFLLARDGEAVAVDPGDATPVLAALEAEGLRLTDILLTHHHDDHIGGVEALRAAAGCRVTGFADDAHRLPPLDRAVRDGETLDVLGERAEVLHVPGHTLGHIAYHLPGLRALFCGDTLFSLGCGRLFEGTPAQMVASLARLAALPDDTLVHCAHEYTEKNAAFALTLEPGNPALRSRAAEVGERRANGLPTVPSTLATEKAANPFLRAHSPEIRATLGMEHADNLAVFTEIRRWRNVF